MKWANLFTISFQKWLTKVGAGVLMILLGTISVISIWLSSLKILFCLLAEIHFNVFLWNLSVRVSYLLSPFCKRASQTAILQNIFKFWWFVSDFSHQVKSFSDIVHFSCLNYLIVKFRVGLPIGILSVIKADCLNIVLKSTCYNYARITLRKNAGCNLSSSGSSKQNLTIRHLPSSIVLAFFLINFELMKRSWRCSLLLFNLIICCMVWD